MKLFEAINEEQNVIYRQDSHSHYSGTKEGKDFLEYSDYISRLLNVIGAEVEGDVYLKFMLDKNQLILVLNEKDKEKTAKIQRQLNMVFGKKEIFRTSRKEGNLRIYDILCELIE